MNLKQKMSMFLAITMIATPIISNAKTIDYTKEYPRHVVFEKADKSLDYKEEPINYVFTIGSHIYTRTDVNKNITIYNPTDAKPYIKNSRTMLPLRYVGYAISADVKWDGSTRTAYFTRDGVTAAIQIDGNKIIMSDGNVYEMDAKPDNINGRIFVSITNVAKAFGLTHGDTLDDKDQDIEWDAEGRVNTTIHMKKLTSSPKKVAEEDKHSWYRHYRDLDNEERLDKIKEPSKEKEEKPVLKTEAPILTTITAGDKEIKGKAIPNSDITVILPDGTKLQTKPDDKGNFVVIVPEDKELKKDDIVKAIAQEKGKAPSDEVSAKVLEKEDTRKDNEKYPLVKPEKTEVKNKDNLSDEEKAKVEEEVKKVNPKAEKIEVKDNGDTTLIYPDGSKNELKQEDTVYEREIQYSKSFNLKQRWDEEKDEQYIDIDFKDGEKLADGSQYKLVKKTNDGYTEINAPIEVKDGNIRIDVKNENIIHNEEYYLETIEEGKEPAYSEVPVKIDKEAPIEMEELVLELDGFQYKAKLNGKIKDEDNSIYSTIITDKNGSLLNIPFVVSEDNSSVSFDSTIEIKNKEQIFKFTVIDNFGNEFSKSFSVESIIRSVVSAVGPTHEGDVDVAFRCIGGAELKITVNNDILLDSYTMKSKWDMVPLLLNGAPYKTKQGDRIRIEYYIYGIWADVQTFRVRAPR